MSTRRGSGKLVHSDVFNDGYGANVAHDGLFNLFYDRERVKQVVNVDDFQIVNIKKKLKISLKKARTIIRFAMLKTYLEGSRLVTERPHFSIDNSHLRSYKLDIREMKKNMRNMINVGFELANFLHVEVETFQHYEKLSWEGL